LAPSDVVVGEKSAPITVVEYFSFACVHCKSFYQNKYQELYDKYIKTGKIKWIKRSIISDKRTLTVALLTQCNGRDHEKYNKYINFLFNRQHVWLSAKNYIEILENISKIAGMSGEDFHKCIDNKALSEELTESTIAAQKKLEIYSTPTIFMNNYLLDLSTDFQDFDKTIELVKKQQ
jgi:protein-disulfide isomerase